MKILSVNAGSSSLKFTLIELPSREVLASGLFEKIGVEHESESEEKRPGASLSGQQFGSI